MANPDVPLIDSVFAVIPKAVYTVYCVVYVTLKERFNF